MPVPEDAVACIACELRFASLTQIDGTWSKAPRPAAVGVGISIPPALGRAESMPSAPRGFLDDPPPAQVGILDDLLPSLHGEVFDSIPPLPRGSQIGLPALRLEDLDDVASTPHDAESSLPPSLLGLASSLPPALRGAESSLPPALRGVDDSVPPALWGGIDDELADLPLTLPSLPPPSAAALPPLPSPRARSAPVASPSRAQVPPPPTQSRQAVAPHAAHSAHGMLDDSFGASDAGDQGPLDDPLGTGYGGPALNLISVAPPAPAPASALKLSPVVPGAIVDATRDRNLHTQAGYGAKPRNLLEVVPYFVRVMQRKHVHAQELASLTLHRKRLEMQAEDAHCALGEALSASKDPAMNALSPQLQAVAQARERMGATEVARREVDEQHRAELEQIKVEVAKLELEAAPLRKRETELQTRSEALKAQIKRREPLVRRCDTELKAFKASTEPDVEDKIETTTVERDALLKQMQGFEAELPALQETLVGVRRELAKYAGKLATRRSEEAGATLAMELEQQRQRASADGARGAYRTALRALATAAQNSRQAALCATEQAAAVESADRARKQIETEELKRAITESYDATSYKHGMYILVGGTALIFVVFAALIMR